MISQEFWTLKNEGISSCPTDSSKSYVYPCKDERNWKK